MDNGCCSGVVFNSLFMLAGIPPVSDVRQHDHMYSFSNSGEFAKWNHIHYLTGRDKKEGSPFSKGLARNALEFWIWGFRKERKMWEFEN